MFKRLFWLTVGMAIGFGTSFWVFRLVRDVAARYTPDRMADHTAAALRALAADLRVAVAEGRAAMGQVDAERQARIGTAPPRPR